MRHVKKPPYKALNFDNKANVIPSLVFNNVKVEHKARDTTTYRMTLDGKEEEVHQMCFCCKTVKPMSSFPMRSQKRIKYLTFGITESWCRDCWNERKRQVYGKGSKKDLAQVATLEGLFG